MTAARSTAEALATLRANGAHRADPVRFRHLEALTRRAAQQQQGLARQMLDARVQDLLQSYVTLSASIREPACDPGQARQPQPGPRPGPLHDLLALLAQTATADHPAPPDAPPGEGPPGAPARPDPLGAGAAADPFSPHPTAMPELRTLQQHRGTWARLRVDRRMAQLQARVPDNAGPLNTPRLLQQALSTLRDTSPDCLQHLLAHVDTLLWLERAVAPALPTAVPARRATAPKPLPGSGRRSARPSGTPR